MRCVVAVYLIRVPRPSNHFHGNNMQGGSRKKEGGKKKLLFLGVVRDALFRVVPHTPTAP